MGAQGPPPLTELPLAQCQPLLGAADFHCYANSNGWVLAKTRRHAEIAAADVARLNADFIRYFATPAPRFAVVSDTNLVTADGVARLRALGAQGVLPWPVNPLFERLGVMNHELGHLYYLVAFPRGRKASWMREVAAILMERPASIRARYRKLAWILHSPHREEMLIPLPTLFTMPNPGHPATSPDDTTLGTQGGIEISGSLSDDTTTDSSSTARADTTSDTTHDRFVPPPDGRYPPGTVFYEECRSLIDFLIERSGDSTIFRAITDRAGKGTQMERWLEQEGVRHHLPSSIAALDLAWRDWMAQHVDARAGLPVSPATGSHVTSLQAMTQGNPTSGPLSQLFGIMQNGSAPPDAPAHDTTHGLLTPGLLHRLAEFWTVLLHEPDSIRAAGRQTYHEQLDLTIPAIGGRSWQVPPMSVVDMVALAQHFPSVATALEHVHLTPAEWTADRRALFTAVLTDQLAQAMGYPPSPIPASLGTSDIIWQNVAFLRAHPSDLAEVRASGMRIPPLPHGIIVTEDTVRLSTATPLASFTVTNHVSKVTDLWLALDCGARSDSAEHDDLLAAAWRHRSSCAVPWLSGFPQHVQLAPDERRTFTVEVHPPSTLPAGHYVARMVWAAVMEDGEELIRHWDFGITYDRASQVHVASPPVAVRAVPVRVTPATLVLGDSALTATLTLRNPAATPAEVWLAVDCPWFRTNLGGLNSSQFESAWHARIPNIALWLGGYPQHLILLPHERRTITFTMSPPIVFGNPPGNYYARVVYAQAPRPAGTVAWAPGDTLLHGAVPLIYHHGASLPLTLQPPKYQEHTDGTAEACVLVRQPGLGTVIRLHAEVDDSHGRPVPVRSARRGTTSGWMLDSTVVVWEVVHHNPEDLDHDADPKSPEPVCFVVPLLEPSGVQLTVTVTPLEDTAKHAEVRAIVALRRHS